MSHLQKLGFKLENGIYKHERAPITAVLSNSDSQCRLVYDLGEDFFAKIIVDVDNTEHELRMGLLEMKKVLEKLQGVVSDEK